VRNPAPPPLHELESEVMEEVWARGEATVRDVQEALNARNENARAYTTLLTVMTRLDGKGMLVRRRAGRVDGAEGG
jgi:predicted transcriptional regulator